MWHTWGTTIRHTWHTWGTTTRHMWHTWGTTIRHMCRVGQNRIYTPYILWFPCQKYCIYTPCIYGSGQPYTSGTRGVQSGLCNDGVTVWSVKIRSDGGHPTWRCQTVISNFGDRHDGAWRCGWRYGLKMAFRPKNGRFGPFSSFLNVACVLFGQTNDWCNNVRKRKVVVLTRIRTLVSTFHSKKALDGGFHNNYGGRSPRPSARSTRQFWNTVILTFWRCRPSTVQKCYDGAIAQPLCTHLEQQRSKEHG